ncbi:hypothetical protein LINPERHAP1_LOCUS32176 [Linum perenne]
MFLGVQLKCLFVRTILMPHISGIHKIENGQYDVALPLLPALHHLSKLL